MALSFPHAVAFTVALPLPHGRPCHRRHGGSLHRRPRPYQVRSTASPVGPQTPPPDYKPIDANPFNKLFTHIFLSKLEKELGEPAQQAVGYDAVIQVVRRLAYKYRGDPSALQNASERVLNSLFPNWLPPAFTLLFSKPFPAFAAWINAAVTVVVTQWLMGPSSIADDNKTVEIERCRYLEETGCVGICVNSCKAATESFFEKNMGIPLAIEPNLEDYSCKFQFGVTPPPRHEDEMYSQPCLSQCPIASPRSHSPCHAIASDSEPHD